MRVGRSIGPTKPTNQQINISETNLNKKQVSEITHPNRTSTYNFQEFGISIARKSVATKESR